MGKCLYDLDSFQVPDKSIIHSRYIELGFPYSCSQTAILNKIKNLNLIIYRLDPYELLNREGLILIRLMSYLNRTYRCCNYQTGKYCANESNDDGDKPSQKGLYDNIAIADS